MEDNAEAGPSRLPAYTPAAQRRRSSRTVRKPSKETIPVIERDAGSDLQRANSLDGGLAPSAVTNGASSSSHPVATPLPASSRRRTIKRKSGQMCDAAEERLEDKGADADALPAHMREDAIADPAIEQSRSDRRDADEQAPSKKPREGSTSQDDEGREDLQQSVEDGGVADAHDHGERAAAERPTPSQEPLQEAVESSQTTTSQVQGGDGSHERATEAVLPSDVREVSDGSKQDESASQMPLDDQDDATARPDLVANASISAETSTVIAARGPAASLPIPQRDFNIADQSDPQKRSASQSAGREGALRSGSAPGARQVNLHVSQLRSPPRSPLRSPPHSSLPASPTHGSGILDDLHDIGEEISQRSSWEEDEARDIERESQTVAEKDWPRELRMEESVAVEEAPRQQAAEDVATEHLFKDSYATEDAARKQGLAHEAGQRHQAAEHPPPEQPAAAGEVAEVGETALVPAPAEESSSLSRVADADAYMDVVDEVAPLLSQWSEEPWQASDPFRTSTPSHETALGTSSMIPPPLAADAAEGQATKPPQLAAADAAPAHGILTSTPDEAGPSSPGPSSSLHHAAASRPSPSVEHRRRRQLSRSISRRSRESFFEDDDDGAGGDAFWDQVIDATDEQGDEDVDGGEEWDLGDADMTLSQIDHDAGAPHSSDEEGETEAALPQAIPAGVFAGFSTAANRRLPEPDAAAMERARRAFDVEDGKAELDIRTLASAKATRRVEPPAAEPVQQQEEAHRAAAAADQDTTAHALANNYDHDYTHEEEQPAVPAVIPQFVSFQKANGAALQLSKTAIEEAAKRMAKWEAEHETRAPEARREGATSSSRPSTPLASRLNGAAPASSLLRSPLAPTASPHANRIVEVAERQQDKEQEDSLASRSASSTSQPATRSDAPAEQPPATPAAASVALPAITPRALPALPPSQPPQQMATPIRPVANRSFFSTSSVPHNASSAFSPNAGASPASRRPRLDARPSRISLGMTPRAKVGSAGTSSRAVFKTPFKGSASGTSNARPPLFSSASAMAAPRSPFVIPSASRSPTKGAATASTSRGALAPTASNPTVFDLSPQPDRLGLKEYGMIPPTPPSARQQRQQPHLVRQQQQQLVAVLPTEITAILRSPAEAGRFAFKSDDSGEAFGIRHALAELHRSGATHIDEAWVRNHWCLIVWKLAAYVRVCVQAYPQAQAQLAVKAACQRWWTFDAAFTQLLYRYEREVNLAQRSIVKRVYEHDSPPGLPMVLLVAGVRRDGEASAPLLELTDGWYRIPVCVDASLSRAIQRGKIRAGQKLAIQGATLSSGGGGGGNVGPKDPLDPAASQPCLSICGNGTSLATWDARLGARKDPMIATLRSLTPDGGAVPCMDIVITRLFPVAYCDGGGAGGGANGGGGGGGGGPSASTGGAPATTTSFGRWGAAEEAEAQREWERRYEDCRARLAAEAEKEAQAAADLQELLRGHLDDDGNAAGEEHDDDDNGAAASRLFDELVNADNTASAAQVLRQGLAELGSSRGSVVRQLVSMAAARSESQRMQWSGDVEAQLAKMCPRRRVRSFRVCRFVDAASTSSGGEGGASLLRRPCKRTVQLTIWDVDGLGGGGGGDAGKSGAGVDGFLVQGRRYRVTNLMPAQRYAWRGADVAADVFLATRRDSRWMRV